MDHRDYQKINAIYKRDQKTNKLLIGDWSLPEFEYLKDCKWRAEEKIDGTNIQIRFNGQSVEIGGRTVNANIPTFLLNKLQEIFTAAKLQSCFPPESEEKSKLYYTNVILYGEGYGAKIQKGGGRYIKNDINFILFDVRIDRWWLKRGAVEQIASALGIKVVPVIGYMSIPEAEEYVRNGFISQIAEDPTFEAEGLVLKTDLGLLDRGGQRIIAKIKTRDFQNINN